MKTQSIDTSPEAEKIQIALLQQASIARRFTLTSSLTHTVIQLAQRAITKLNSGKSERELNLIFVENHYGKDLAKRLRVHNKMHKMKSPEILATITPVVEAFEKLSIPYHISGSIASSVYGIARTTLDVDFVADIKKRHVTPLVSLLKSKYYIDKEMIVQAIQRQTTFNLVHLDSMFKIDIFILKQRPYDKEAFRRKRKEVLDETQKLPEFYLVSPEDLILNKLEWYRMGNETSERQWNDVLGVLKVQKGRIDLNYLQRWAYELDISDLLDRALQDAGY